jgi:hypothetical protein
MKHYMIVETRDPADSRDVDWIADVAAALQRRGARASVLLIENGVLAARAEAEAPALLAAIKAGCPVMADRYSLRERGVRDVELNRGIVAA